MKINIGLGYLVVEHGTGVGYLDVELGIEVGHRRRIEDLGVVEKKSVLRLEFLLQFGNISGDCTHILSFLL